MAISPRSGVRIPGTARSSRNLQPHSWPSVIGGQFCDFIYRRQRLFLAARRFEIGDWSRPPANGDDRTRLITYGTGRRQGQRRGRRACCQPPIEGMEWLRFDDRRRAREPGAEFIAHGLSRRRIIRIGALPLVDYFDWRSPMATMFARKPGVWSAHMSRKSARRSPTYRRWSRFWPTRCASARPVGTHGVR